MATEESIDDLIEAGWCVLDSDFDPIAFHRWRRSAFHCLTDMLGPDHYYTRHFGNLLRQGEKVEELSCSGHTERSPTTDGRERASTGQN